MWIVLCVIDCASCSSALLKRIPSPRIPRASRSRAKIHDLGFRYVQDANQLVYRHVQGRLKICPHEIPERRVEISRKFLHHRSGLSTLHQINDLAH